MQVTLGVTYFTPHSRHTATSWSQKEARKIKIKQNQEKTKKYKKIEKYKKYKKRSGVKNN